jgi:predicted GTPase
MIKTLIMGAGGRDFHNFLMYFKDNPDYKVEAFTWAQIEGVNITHFPQELAGHLYDKDIPIYLEKNLEEVIEKYNVRQVFFCYSDVSHEQVMHTASRVNAVGADFILKGFSGLRVDTGLPTIAVTAVRTGCGKSGVTRYIAKYLKEKGATPVVVRHPMVYRDLITQKAERFATLADLAHCTIEELEEFEPLVNAGLVVWCGVDYKTIIKTAKNIDNPTHFIWDGGNNDDSFLKYDKKIVIVDPFRWGHTDIFYPGELNLLTADVVVVNKVNTACESDIDSVIDIARGRNPSATIIKSKSTVHQSTEDIHQIPKSLNPEKVLVIEDGPTTTHGDMKFGVAGLTWYRLFGVRPKMLSAVGYNNDQLKELEQRINNSDAELVIGANNIDLNRIICIEKPYIRWSYENKFDVEFDNILEEFIGGHGGL